MTIICDVCGSAIAIAKTMFYTDDSGEERDDGREGDYIEGSGSCEICGRELCANCGDFIDGVCKECREEELESRF